MLNLLEHSTCNIGITQICQQFWEETILHAEIAHQLQTKLHWKMSQNNWAIFHIKTSPNFVVPYPHWSVQTTSRDQWFPYAHIHTSDDATVECLWQQLKSRYIALSWNTYNKNIMQRTLTSTYCTYHHKANMALL